MKPHEFWNCTYREAYEYAKSSSLQREDEYKQEIALADALGTKLIKVFARKRPQNYSLVSDAFGDLFRKELEEKSQQQTLEEQIRNLRSRK